MNLREKLLTPQPLKVEEISLPDLGETVLISAIHGGDRDEYEFALAKADKKPYRAMWIAMCVRDMEGNKVFTPDDIQTIADTWTARDTNKAFNKAAELNGLSEDERESIKNE